jgi:hypothetical protein
MDRGRCQHNVKQDRTWLPFAIGYRSAQAPGATSKRRERGADLRRGAPIAFATLAQPSHRTPRPINVRLRKARIAPEAIFKRLKSRRDVRCNKKYCSLD